MKLSDYIAGFLESKKVTHVYYLIGGMITHIVDSLHQKNAARVITMHHEQAAGFAAEGGARMTGIPGVALATSGPGAVNLLTAVGSCFFDSTPAVFITGQVNRHELRGGRRVRQLGFQETDIVAMARPITKAAWLVEDPSAVPETLAKAFELAIEGRPGPVLVDLPMDIQRAEIDPPRELKLPAASCPAPNVEEIFRDLGRARFPLILAGGGVRSSRCAEAFKKLIEKMHVPMVYSLQGVDLLPFGHPERVGMIGTYGNRWANLALGKSDFLLVLGSRLDVRQTGADAIAFERGKVIHHVDVEEGEINSRLANCIAHVSSLPATIEEMLRSLPTSPANDIRGWAAEIVGLRDRWPDTSELSGIDGINPNTAMHMLSSQFQDASAYVVDVGNHQMWAAQSLETSEGQRFLTSAGMGAMGFALPAAVGAAFASGGAPVVVIVGDGGFQCNIQELQTVVRNSLNIKIVVVDNFSLGMVRQFQESYFGARFEGTQWGYSAPDCAKVAMAYGIDAQTVEREEGLQEAFSWLAASRGPALVRMVLRPQTNAYPKIAFGRPITEMEPLSKPLGMGQRE